MPTSRCPGARLAGPAAVLLLAVLAGCSGGSSGGAATSAANSSGPSASTKAASGSASPGSPTSAAPRSTVATTRPAPVPSKGVASCTALPASRVARLLGATVAAGIPDHRAGADGRRQLEGCSYTGAGGLRLDYVIWRLSTNGTAALVQQGLPPAITGAVRFAPGVGTQSAGAVVAVGPVSTAQVNAVRRARLVQVSASAATAAAARSAATEAAAALIGR